MQLGSAGSYGGSPGGFGVGSASAYASLPGIKAYQLPHPASPTKSSTSSVVLPVGAVPSTNSVDGDQRPGFERSWGELTAEQQEGLRRVGYDRGVWDEERGELAAARMMAAENDDEEQRRALEAADAATAAAAAAEIDALSPQLSHQLPASASAAAGGGFGAESGGGFDFGASERTNSGLTATDSELGHRGMDPTPEQPASPFTQAAPGGSVDVIIVDTELDEENGKMYYLLDITRSPQFAPGPQRVRKRYSEFESLRKDLAASSRAAKALDFPAKKRIKGKRGGKKDKIVDVRTNELQQWLNTVIRVCQSDPAS